MVASRVPAGLAAAPHRGSGNPAPWENCDALPHHSITTPSGHGGHHARGCGAARLVAPVKALLALPARAAGAAPHGRRTSPARLRVFRC